MSKKLYPHLLKAQEQDHWTLQHTENAIAASAEGYPFPTNLDFDVPIGGLAPPSMAETVAQAVAGKWSQERLEMALDGHAIRKRSYYPQVQPPSHY